MWSCSARSCRWCGWDRSRRRSRRPTPPASACPPSLIGGTPEQYDLFWAGVRAGVINWNRPTNGAPSNAPFGGVGLSGNHRPSAFYAADYCAYPVVSAEAQQARAAIGVGLKGVIGDR